MPAATGALYSICQLDGLCEGGWPDTARLRGSGVGAGAARLGRAAGSSQEDLSEDVGWQVRPSQLLTAAREEPGNVRQQANRVNTLLCRYAPLPT